MIERWLGRGLRLSVCLRRFLELSRGLQRAFNLKRHGLLCLRPWVTIENGHVGPGFACAPAARQSRQPSAFDADYEHERHGWAAGTRPAPPWPNLLGRRQRPARLVALQLPHQVLCPGDRHGRQRAGGRRHRCPWSAGRPRRRGRCRRPTTCRRGPAPPPAALRRPGCAWRRTSPESLALPRFPARGELISRATSAARSACPRRRPRPPPASRSASGC
jgi:hypothetical protein